MTVKGGDDEILTHRDGGGDAIYCGEDFDKVYYDLVSQIGVNCEEKQPVVN